MTDPFRGMHDIWLMRGSPEHDRDAFECENDCDQEHHEEDIDGHWFCSRCQMIEDEGLEAVLAMEEELNEA